jgi:hypothetical protein
MTKEEQEVEFEEVNSSEEESNSNKPTVEFDTSLAPAELTFDQQVATLKAAENSFMDQVAIAFKNKLLPSIVKNLEEAFIYAQTGRELGFPALTSFNLLYVLPQTRKPSLTYQGLGYLIRRSKGSFIITKDYEVEYWTEKDKDDPEKRKFKRDANGNKIVKSIVTEMKMARPDDIIKDEHGNPVLHTFQFTYEDAVGMGYYDLKDDGKPKHLNYFKQPKVMYRARCLASGARILFPDLINGYYLADELDETGTVTYDSEGQIKILEVE